MNPYNGNYGQTIQTDGKVNIDMAFLGHMVVTAAEAVATSGTGIKTATNLLATAQTIITGITDPAVPRALSVVGNVSGITGNVLIIGKNYNDEVITETIALNAATPVFGAKAFKNVTSIALPIRVHTPVSQIETATVVGAIIAGGNASVVITAAGMTGTPKTISVPVIGTLQVETSTVAGVIAPAGAGNATVIVTAAGMTGSPITLSVAVANDDTASDVAGKIRTAMGLNANIAAFFAITGATSHIILTRLAATANDLTMNISVNNGTCSGLTPALTSADTLAGVVGDTATIVAGKIIAALNLDAAVTALFTVGGTGATVTLTKIIPVADDGTLNIATDNGTCTGLTTAGTSVNTLNGVPYDKVSVGFNDIMGLPFKLSHNTVLAAYLGNTKEATPPTVIVSSTVLESNTIVLNSALNGTIVDIYLIV
jgi:hypothetical protein